MSSKGTGRCSVLFRINHGSDIYSIPVQYVTRVESLARQVTSIPHAPEHIVGVYRLQEKNINIVDLGCLLSLEHAPNNGHSKQSLLIIVNSRIGFWVENVLGIETLCLRQDPGSLSSQLVQSVYLCDDRNELILELDVPRLLSIC